MDARQFAEYFETIHETRPFPWQQRLVDQVAETGAWPFVIDLPTAAGKSSVVDVAVYTLAMSASRQNHRLPRRIFFVVDRRIIVDAVYERAGRIARKLKDPTTPLLREMAERLNSLTGANTARRNPLLVTAMRGGLSEAREWAKSPTQPLVCATTVDQLGSRLLFRGYGLSQGPTNMLSIHAGLAANDALIVLDEAHLSQPFAETLGAIADYRRFNSLQQTELCAEIPWFLVRMSATPGNESEAFVLSAEDDKPDALGPRLHARKWARLYKVQGESVKDGQDDSGKQVEDRNRLELETEIHRRALTLASEDPSVLVIGIVVNRVKSARRLYKRFRDDALRSGLVADFVLMTGRQRPWERERLLKKWMPILQARPMNARTKAARQVFVIATQCIEVGADIDFDVLVTECAALDALRQRFGRLNRLGIRPESQAAIVCLDTRTRNDDDPIYGSALKSTWKWLLEHARKPTKNKGTGIDAPIVDMGIIGVREILERTANATDLDTSRLRAPVILPSYFDLWSQTSPLPAYSPEPSFFLHGNERYSADVSIVWRVDLNDKNAEHWQDIVNFVPPTSKEAVSVPIWEAKRWLRGQDDAVDADVEGMCGNGEERVGGVASRGCLRWCGKSNIETRVIPPQFVGQHIRPGDTLVVPASYGGLEEGTWSPTTTMMVKDVADMLSRGRWATLRLNDAMLMQALNDEAEEDAKQEFFKEFRSRLRVIIDQRECGLEAESEIEIRHLLQFLRDQSILSEDFLARVDRFRELSGLECIGRYPDGALVGEPGSFFTSNMGIILRAKSDKRGLHDDMEEFDENGESPQTAEVALHAHLSHVEACVRSFAVTLGMSMELQSDLALAAAFHDIGKVDGRFQHLLGSFREVKDTDLQHSVLAKSIGRARGYSEYRRVCREAGYPVGYRHEASSVALALSCANLLEAAFDPDLVLHLIASHHGCARPFFRFVEDDEVELECKINGEILRATTRHGLERADSGVSDRFWRLVKRYGWYGLAYLEAVFRLADHRASELEEAGTYE